MCWLGCDAVVMHGIHVSILKLSYLGSGALGLQWIGAVGQELPAEHR